MGQPSAPPGGQLSVQPASVAFPRRAPGWPLAATLGVHLLLAWSWRIAHPPVPASGEAQAFERVLELIPVPPPTAETARARPEPAPPPATRSPSPARPRPVGAAPEPEAITVPAETPTTVTDTFAPPPAAAFPDSAPTASAASPLEAMVGRARRDAGIIDREMRKGKSGVPEVADTPWGRFRQALEGAHKDSSRGLASETYTAPDGQVIYRFRQGGKVWCRTGGSVGPQIGGAEGGGATLFDRQGGGGSAGMIRCPSHADWQRN